MTRGKSLKVVKTMNRNRKKVVGTRKAGKPIFNIKNLIKNANKNNKNANKPNNNQRRKDKDEIAALEGEIGRLRVKADIDGKMLGLISEEKINAIEHKIRFLETRIVVLKHHQYMNIDNNENHKGGRRT